MIKPTFFEEINTMRRLMNLQEYHADQRLPFDNSYYGKKTIGETFFDWIQDFGKIGTLPSSKINFMQGVLSGVDKAYEWENGEPPPTENERYEFIKNIDARSGFISYHKLNGRGLLYVERAIGLKRMNLFNRFSDKYYNQLVSDYQNNVGGCWTWSEGASKAYCNTASNSGTTAILHGYIRLEDIDWVETDYINQYHMSEECEIRVKPNAQVEVFQIDIPDKIIDPKSGHPSKDATLFKKILDKPIIVTSTYFGNNETYHGDYAPLYNSEKENNPDYIDRKGNILPITKLAEQELEKINNGETSNILGIDRTEGNLSVIYIHGKFNVIDLDDNDRIISPNLWFDFVRDNPNGGFNLSNYNTHNNTFSSYWATNDNNSGKGTIHKLK